MAETTAKAVGLGDETSVGTFATDRSTEPTAQERESTPVMAATASESGSGKKRKLAKLTEEELAERAEKKKKLEQKRLEKEERKRKKEEEIKEKEEKKRKKEEEIKEKERKQLRLASFFKKPTKPQPAEAEPEAATRSDYETVFLPFHVKTNCVVYPQTKFGRDEKATDAVKARLDKIIASPAPSEAAEAGQVWAKVKRRNGSQGMTTKDLIALYSNISKGIPTTVSMSEPELVELVRQLPRKFLLFCEDIRPPYYGTFTKPFKYRRNPFVRQECVDYDYDSEAEWVVEDGEPGEDLETATNESDDENDDFIDDDMQDFVVTEDDDRPKRRVLAPLVPVAKGVCWTDLRTGVNAGFDGTDMQIATIQPNITLPIDPFKNYWSVTKATETKPPLQPANTNKSTKPSLSRVPESDLKQLLMKIQGSDMNQLMLIETLKKEFKSIPKESIRLTVKEVAKRVGDKEVNKRWIIDSEIWDRYVGQSLSV